MTTDERWLRAKSLRKSANVIYIINLLILISIFLLKCTHSEKELHTVKFVSNASVIGASVNIREQPSLSGGILMSATNGSRIFVIDSSSNSGVVKGKLGFWYKVRLQNGTEGFIWSAAVKRDD
ncbi:MAG: SH3 domain-containing protein [Bacteroidetes bacterium]|nr:SH3 domain-containing protein [Bacteroidota bacterium]